MTMKTHQEKSIQLWKSAVALSSEEWVIQKVYAQLEKDFNRCALPFTLHPQSNPSSWIVELAESLQHLSSATLSQLLYLIDIPESLSTELRAASDNLAQLAGAIIYRELVKVHSKISYSANTNPNNTIDFQ